jgi:hypothetical protein
MRKKILLVSIAVLIFCGIMSIPFGFMTLMGHIMRGGTTWTWISIIFSKDDATATWWLMGFAAIVWLPVSVVFSAYIAARFITRNWPQV